MTRVRSATRLRWVMIAGLALTTSMMAASAAATESGRSVRTWSPNESIILVKRGNEGTIMNGTTDDIRAARGLRSGDEPLLYFRRGGKAYVVSDPVMLREAQNIVKPQEELGARQAALGARQGALGAKQGALGARQAALAARHSHGGPRPAVLARQQAELGRQQAELGRQQSELGRQQSVLGRQQARLGRETQARLRTLIDDALRRGIAREVG